MSELKDSMMQRMQTLPEEGLDTTCRRCDMVLQQSRMCNAAVATTLEDLHNAWLYQSQRNSTFVWMLAMLHTAYPGDQVDVLLTLLEG